MQFFLAHRLQVRLDSTRFKHLVLGNNHHEEHHLLAEYDANICATPQTDKNGNYIFIATESNLVRYIDMAYANNGDPLDVKVSTSNELDPRNYLRISRLITLAAIAGFDANDNEITSYSRTPTLVLLAICLTSAILTAAPEIKVIMIPHYIT
jgi:hypothetical protein